MIAHYPLSREPASDEALWMRNIRNFHILTLLTPRFYTEFICVLVFTKYKYIHIADLAHYEKNTKIICFSFRYLHSIGLFIPTADFHSKSSVAIV